MTNEDRQREATGLRESYARTMSDNNADPSLRWLAAALEHVSVGQYAPRTNRIKPRGW